MPTEEKLSLLRSVLQSPLFHQILALQKSVQHLRDQVCAGCSETPPTDQRASASRASRLTVPSVERCVSPVSPSPPPPPRLTEWVTGG